MPPIRHIDELLGGAWAWDDDDDDRDGGSADDDRDPFLAGAAR